MNDEQREAMETVEWEQRQQQRLIDQAEQLVDEIERLVFEVYWWEPKDDRLPRMARLDRILLRADARLIRRNGGPQFVYREARHDA